jgi:hypothetical protein
MIQTNIFVSYQGSLTEGEGSLRSTSSHLLVKMSSFLGRKYYLQIYKTTYLNEEVNCNEPSPLISIPCSYNYRRSAAR